MQLVLDLFITVKYIFALVISNWPLYYILEAMAVTECIPLDLLRRCPHHLEFITVNHPYSFKTIHIPPQGRNLDFTAHIIRIIAAANGFVRK
jgi:hypothetical protein